MNVGIVGLGYVGTAVETVFKEYYKVITYDINKKCSAESLDTLVEQTDIIFLCLPTPMNSNGSCNISIIENVLSELNNSDNIKDKIIAIKSTISPGTTIDLQNKYINLNLVFNPEFLTEKNYINDFRNQNRIIIGGKKKNMMIIEKIYKNIFKNIPIILTDSTTAEMVKYLTNTFLATKVSFANEMKVICDNLEINYNQVVKYSLFDQRLGSSHWNVPGHDGKLGFGGSCLPKDLNSMIFVANNLGLDLNLLKSVWKTNIKVRPERDWEKLKGRAVMDDNNE